MLPCRDCAYMKNIPGSCHIRCMYAWEQDDFDGMPEIDRVPMRARKWFLFPLNYDPVWGPDECQAKSSEVDVKKYSEGSPIEDILSLMGKRLFE